MNEIASPVMVEDLFLTDTFLIKGRLVGKHQRLAKMLEAFTDGFLQVEDAAMVSLRSSEVIRSPRVLVNPRELILAHELIDFAGDSVQRQLARTEKNTRIRAFYNGAVQLELSGMIEQRAYEPNHRSGQRYFVMENPRLRGIQVGNGSELSILAGLSYAIVRKDRLAYVYDFS
ncbi:MAG: hypothetical protein KDC87_13200 [Planctomycetes bacterium]|nr:hypothetical protein [Planctomycetota bacterium]MCB9872062.1 hypothetical protein [Planctomycetota bacterium]MCB9889786.1 hypothetical protein [Planctomycetota bacterium]